MRVGSVITTLTFKEIHGYGIDGDEITVPVELSVANRRVRLFPKLDTGSAFCIFQREHGEALGLDVEAGVPRTMRTATGSFETFGHEVNIDSFGWRHTATAYFTAEYEFPRNVLGRNGWIRQFRVGLIDYDQTLCISHYDDP